MNKITLFFLLLLSQTIFAQFAPSDVAYYVGSGSKTDYWAIWSGTASNNMILKNGVDDEILVDQKWYGFS